jgi:predicted CXXCH cytochrome family protein
MIRRPSSFVVRICALVVCAGVAAAQDSRAAGTCANCHAPAEALHRTSVHGAGAASCVDCHGGDPAGKTEAAAHSGSYRGKIARTAVPQLCAECHSDVRRMLPFGLPTDQFKTYAASGHGEATLRRGSAVAAVCTDCHGVHDARKAADPAAATHPQRLAATCDKCHADAALMTPLKKSATVGREFHAGAHGKALAAGNPNAPSCASCHGSHGATAPGAREVADVCGRCHTEEKREFLGSAHGGKGAASGKVRCVDCHAAHETHGATQDFVAGCAQCHAAGTPEAAAAGSFADVMRTADVAAREAKADLDRAATDLAVAGRAGELLAELVPGMGRMRAAAHSLDLDGVRKFSDRLKVVGAEARDLAEHRHERLVGRRIMGGTVAVGVASVVAGLLMLRAAAGARRRRAAARATAGGTAP